MTRTYRSSTEPSLFDDTNDRMSEVVPGRRNTRKNTKLRDRYETCLPYVLELVGQAVVKYVGSFMEASQVVEILKGVSMGERAKRQKLEGVSSRPRRIPVTLIRLSVYLESSTRTPPAYVGQLLLPTCFACASALHP